jgi:hypothetical protein
MKITSNPIVRLFLKTILFTIILGLISFVIGWLFGWRTTLQFSNEFFIIGGLLIAIGTLSVAGGFMLRGNYPLNVAQSAGVLSQTERTNQNVINTVNTYSTLIILSISGLILIICSIGIDQIVK